MPSHIWWQRWDPLADLGHERITWLLRETSRLKFQGPNNENQLPTVVRLVTSNLTSVVEATLSRNHTTVVGPLHATLPWQREQHVYLATAVRDNSVERVQRGLLWSELGEEVRRRSIGRRDLDWCWAACLLVSVAKCIVAFLCCKFF